MNYLIAVYPDRITAEAAYTDLEQSEIPKSDLTILGKGYQTADEFGFIDPTQQGKKQAKLMSFWLVPFGFFGGFVFDYITGLNTFAWAGTPGNHIVGGLAGAIGGAMGSFFVGNSIGVLMGSGDALPYRNRLNMGKYLVIYKYDVSQYRDLATRIFQDTNPENLQGYSEESA
ncbi:hypothetical protein Lepto7376_0482 [[Leptolyngbya] sp. PCC 7376]|uniref:hypothetical protein n=1 Tax=[Leptolyngbya] sp. PCC 7376 TaxID=111781 RepID=UPI00029F0BBC|nr:hypothetical protein [[Leptolyngbya] sp. PCC 7376]AFY36914.1 hypothetical protein Lepto7376_0482 [[Leptolyngbya] sp. PCC 7376]